MEENLESLLEAIKTIKLHCEKTENCIICVLSNEEEECRVTDNNVNPAEWIEPKIKTKIFF